MMQDTDWRSSLPAWLTAAVAGCHGSANRQQHTRRLLMLPLHWPIGRCSAGDIVAHMWCGLRQCSIMLLRRLLPSKSSCAAFRSALWSPLHLVTERSITSSCCTVQPALGRFRAAYHLRGVADKYASSSSYFVSRPRASFSSQSGSDDVEIPIAVMSGEDLHLGPVSSLLESSPFKQGALHHYIHDDVSTGYMPRRLFAGMQLMQATVTTITALLTLYLITLHACL